MTVSLTLFPARVRACMHAFAYTPVQLVCVCVCKRKKGSAMAAVFDSRLVRFSSLFLSLLVSSALSALSVFQ